MNEWWGSCGGRAGRSWAVLPIASHAYGVLGSRHVKNRAGVGHGPGSQPTPLLEATVSFEVGYESLRSTASDLKEAVAPLRSSGAPQASFGHYAAVAGASLYIAAVEAAQKDAITEVEEMAAKVTDSSDAYRTTDGAVAANLKALLPA